MNKNAEMYSRKWIYIPALFFLRLFLFLCNVFHTTASFLLRFCLIPVFPNLFVFYKIIDYHENTKCFAYRN